MRVLAVDPGSEQSGYVAIDNENRPFRMGILDNQDFLYEFGELCSGVSGFAVERTNPYVMTTKDGHPYVPKQLAQTWVFIGELKAYWDLLGEGGEVAFVGRRDALKYVTGKGSRVGDKEMREGLIELYGGREVAVGLKKNPGPLYGVKSHIWAALGVAVTFNNTIKGAPF